MNIKSRILNNALAAFVAFAMALQLMPPSVLAQDNTPSIQIVYTNDTHGYYTATDRGVLGFAMLKSVVEAEEADLVLDIGDTFHGQAFATLEQGESIAELMKAVGYDAMTPGNHDFSYGAERLKELEKAGGFKILAANIVTDSGDDYFDSPYLVKDVTADDGTVLKVGVVGVVDDKFYSSTASDNVKGLKFNEEAEQATKTAQYLRENEQCDIVIAITHQSDCEGFVANIKGIDAVLAGHEHLIIDKVYTDSEGNSVPVAEAGYYFYNIGVMEMTVDADTKKVVAVSNSTYSADTLNGLTENEAVKAEIAQKEAEQEVILSQNVGYSSVDCPYSWEDIRTSRQAIGNFVTESYLEKTGADIAFENAGGIRAGISVGDVTYKDIISISPYGNVLVTKKVTGSDVLDIMKKSAEIGAACDSVYTLQKEAEAKGEDPYQYSWPDNSGSYLQFGGIEIETDENGVILSAEVNGEPIDENKLYTIATNNYTAESSDYEALSAAELDKEYSTCEAALSEYIEKQTKIDDEIVPTRGAVVEMLLDASGEYSPIVQKNDIIKGYEDGLLYEDRVVTRAEALIMLNRAFGELPIVSDNKANFADVPEWAATELDNVLNSGIVEETANGLLSPNETVTVGEMRAFIRRAAALLATK